MSKDVKFNIRLSVDGKDQIVTATAKVKDLATSLNDAQKAAANAVSAGTKWREFATAASGTITSINAIRGALSDLTAESNQFTAAMKEANTMAGKDGAGFQQLNKQVTELSESVPMARDALAKGLYQVISNGVPEDNWMSYLEKSAKASVGGLADLQEVVKVTSTVIKNYGLSWEDAEKVQDKIQLTAKNGVTSFEQLAQALPKVASKRQVAAVAGSWLTDNILPSKGQIREFGYVCRPDAAVIQLISALHGHTRIFLFPFNAEKTPSAKVSGNPGRR